MDRLAEMTEMIPVKVLGLLARDGVVDGVLVICAFVFAVVCGFSLWKAYESWMRTRRHRASVVPGKGGAGSPRDRSSGGRVVSLMEKLSHNPQRGAARTAGKESPRERQLELDLKLAGLSDKVTPQGFGDARLKLAVLGAAAGFLAGALFSMPLSFIGGAVGAAAGFRLPSRTVRACIKERTHESERHLPEMLDVVALGMRSGLSFDSSLRVYAQHFDTVLSRELECARVQWSSGLVRRDEALRELASTYDSVVFGRVVETIIRSIRYGSSMVESLESDAAEARSAYQAEREERVAKTPVKMMVPTGVLILPAMLVLVLGPVLLELMEGGI